MPESTSDLERLLERWSREAAAAEPLLRPHLNELTDYLRSETAARVADGADLDAAFAQATDALGAPAALSREYARGRSVPSLMFGWLVDERHRTRTDLTIAGAWIGMSLAWAAAAVAGPIVGLDLSTKWMLVGWYATTFGPLTVLDTVVRRGRRAA